MYIYVSKINICKVKIYFRCRCNSVFWVFFNFSEEIVEIIKEYIRDENIIVEGNPGLGFITNYLIKLGIKKMYIIEYKENSTPFFQHVLREHTNSIQLIEGNIFMPFGKSRNLLKGLILSTYEKSKLKISQRQNYLRIISIINALLKYFNDFYCKILIFCRKSYQSHWSST